LIMGNTDSREDRGVIPFLDFGGSGAPLIFLHANGYPPACYRPLLAQLAKHYHVIAMLQRPLWPGSKPQDLDDWAPLTADLVRFLDAMGATPAQVVGHSLGAIVGLRAAIRRPEAFRGLVLIEPVLFPPRRILQWWFLRLTGRTERHPLVVASRNRRQSFDDLDRLFSAYRQRAVFRYMDDEALFAYISGLTCPDGEGGYRLCYGADWETRIYLTGIWHDLDLWRGLPRIKLPILMLRGAETDTFWNSTSSRVRRANPDIEVRTFGEATHLLPLEKPRQTAQAVLAFLPTHEAEFNPSKRAQPAETGGPFEHA
jgi:pimeloyl-ACP methyl ester carboxylesterase